MRAAPSFDQRLQAIRASYRPSPSRGPPFKPQLVTSACAKPPSFVRTSFRRRLAGHRRCGWSDGDRKYKNPRLNGACLRGCCPNNWWLGLHRGHPENVADIHQRATEAIAAIRAVAHRVAQFMVVARRIDKDIFAIDLADGGGFKELVTVKASVSPLPLKGSMSVGPLRMVIMSFPTP